MNCIILDEILFAQKDPMSELVRKKYIHPSIHLPTYLSANPAWGQSFQAHSSHYHSLRHLGEGSCPVVSADSYVGFYFPSKPSKMLNTEGVDP